MNTYENLWRDELKKQIGTYDILLNATYHLIRGTELVNCLDISQCPPIIAELARKIKPHTIQLEPFCKQLDYYLIRDCNDD